MSYLRALFCCDTTLQLANIDTSVYEVVRASKGIDRGRKILTAAELQQMRMETLRKSKVVPYRRTSPLRSRGPARRPGVQAVRLELVSSNKGDDEEPECLADLGPPPEVAQAAPVDEPATIEKAKDPEEEKQKVSLGLEHLYVV